jgi:hypothetical protein
VADQPPESPQPARRIWPAWIYHRRDRIVAEVERNRRGEYVVPTWALAALLVAIVAGWALLVILS